MIDVVKYVEKINTYCLGLVSLQLKQWSVLIIKIYIFYNYNYLIIK